MARRAHHTVRAADDKWSRAHAGLGAAVVPKDTLVWGETRRRAPATFWGGNSVPQLGFNNAPGDGAIDIQGYDGHTARSRSLPAKRGKSALRQARMQAPRGDAAAVVEPSCACDATLPPWGTCYGAFDGLFDGVRAFETPPHNWQQHLFGSKEPGSQTARDALLNMPPAGEAPLRPGGCITDLPTRRGRRTVSVPGSQNKRHGRRTFQSASNSVDAVDQVVFQQDADESRKTARDAEFSDIFVGHAGKPSWMVEDEGGEFLLMNDGPLYTPPHRDKEAHQAQFGRRKNKQKYESEASELMYPEEKSAACFHGEPAQSGQETSHASQVIVGLSSRGSPKNAGLSSRGTRKSTDGKRVFSKCSSASSVDNVISGACSTAVPEKLPIRGKKTYTHLKEEMSLAELVCGGSEARNCPAGDTQSKAGTPRKLPNSTAREANYAGHGQVLPPAPDKISSDESIANPKTPEVLPTLFVSHGSGPFPLMCDADHPVVQSFSSVVETALGSSGLKLVKAIVIVSAHWETDDGIQVTFNNGVQPQHLFYDYCGFPPEMYNLRYNPMGSPDLSTEILALLKARGIRTTPNMNRRLDHGVFVPIMLMRGLESLPVVQISLPRVSKDWQQNAHMALEIGRAIAPLRAKGVLVLGSGQSTCTHRARADAKQFVDALKTLCTSAPPQQRTVQLEQWRRILPKSREVHEREDHLLPLLFAAGAAECENGAVVGDLWSGSLAMTHFSFGKSLSEEEYCARPLKALEQVSARLEELDNREVRPSSTRRSSGLGAMMKSARSVAAIAS